MKKYLLPHTGTFYKANLHCHTLASDGKLTHEEVKARYKAQGYSVLAYTDHNIMVDTSYLTDPDFLTLNGYEVNINMQPYQAPRGSRCSAEFNFIAPTPETKMLFFQEKYLGGTEPEYEDKIMRDENEKPYERYYSPECVNDMIRIAREAGYYISYNHPLSSQENYLAYSRYKGMHSMEIYNHGSWYGNNTGYAPQVYDDILKTGNMIYCVATDDNHSTFDNFGGYVMIRADKLDYSTIIEALKNGHFYASTGPEIHDVWYEDGYVHISCSPAQYISLNTGTTFAKAKHAENGELLTEVSFKLHPLMKYVRFTVMDENKNLAWSNAYSIKEFLDEIKE